LSQYSMLSVGFQVTILTLLTRFLMALAKFSVLMAVPPIGKNRAFKKHT